MWKHIELDFRGKHFEDEDAINYFKSGTWLIDNKEDILNNSKKAIDIALESLNRLEGDESLVEITIFASADGCFGIEDFKTKKYDKKFFIDDFIGE